MKLFRCSQLDFQNQEVQERLGETPECKKNYEQFEVAVCVVAIWGELSGGEVSGSVFFSRRKLSGKELPGEELSTWGYCPGVTVRGELSGGEFTGHPIKYHELV